MRFILSLLAGAACFAQAPLTVQQAVDQALAKYPSVRVSQEQVSAAAAGIDLARTAYLPRVDTLGQVNRATRNNVFGLLLLASACLLVLVMVLRPQGLLPERRRKLELAAGLGETEMQSDAGMAGRRVHAEQP